MKKLMLIIGITSSLFTMSASAEQSRAEVYRWSHESIRNGRERTPARLPTIDVVYNPTIKSIEIVCSMDCDATVFIYDINGNLIDSADSLDAVLSVAGINSPFFSVRIESSNWYAIAELRI